MLAFRVCEGFVRVLTVVVRSGQFEANVTLQQLSIGTAALQEEDAEIVAGRGVDVV